MYKKFEYKQEKDYVSQTIYQNFEMMNPSLAKDVSEWYDVGNLTIIVILSNGEAYEYNEDSDSIRKMRELDEYGYEEIDEEYFKRKFARKLNRLMRFRGLDQSELAEACNTSQVMISHYATGKCVPSGYMIEKIAKALQCHIEDLF